ncbi:MAG: tetratricopeptide repeat protein [Gammaproteobacteria bacterium]|nr:MAG: tetratricopeptide repeat protein [Gammaproteobacteria bacterium]
MANDPQAAYAFGRFTLVPSEKRILCDGKVVPLPPKVFDTLVLLVENQGRLIQKEELLKALWPDTVVEEVALAHNVSQLRKALGDPAEDPKFIETVPKRGYRFIAAVRELGEPAPRAASPASSGVAPSAVQHAQWSRPTILATLAAVLVLVAGVAVYVYLPRTGQRAAGVPPAIHSLAVLPLENLSGDKEQEYFADGMTDEVITELGKVGALRVISRTSVMQYKGTRKPLSDIAPKLNVDAVVEGTILRSGNRVRITAQLIEASSDRHLWARSYERDLKDVLALQGEVARDIAEEIRIKLTPKERTLLTEAHAIDPEAHDAYLRGRYWWSKRDAEGEWKGLDYFQRAVAKDPNYALAYVGVADSFVVLGHHGHLPPQEALPKAKEAAMKALELDPSLAEAHTSLAIVKQSYDWDWSGAEREFKEAIALNPNYATAHHWYSHYLVAMGRLDEAVNELERARDLDPFSIPINDFLGMTLYYARRYDDAVRQFRRGLEMHPDRVEFHEGIANIYEQKKLFAEAFAEHQQVLSLNKDTQTAAALEQAYQRFGYRGYLGKRIQSLEQSLQQAPKSDLFTVLFLAHMYAVLNDEAHAMSCLERAYDERNPWLLNVQVDPAMDSLRSSPRFRDLVRRIGLPLSSLDKN